MQTLLETERKIIKKSQKRLIIYGDSFEIFQYENPYFYNLPALTRGSRGSRDTRPRRDDNLAALKTEVRRIVEGNHNKWGEVCKFVTYTFADNVSDVSEALVEWKTYNRSLRNRFGRLKYLSVIEFQKRGAVHFHVLYFNMPYMPKLKERIAATWSRGFTQVRAVRSVRALGCYISKYMTKNIDDRLIGKKAYFTSRGLYRPVIYRNEETIDTFEKTDTIQIEAVKNYESARLGKITHKLGKYANSNTGNVSST